MSQLLFVLLILTTALIQGCSSSALNVNPDKELMLGITGSITDTSVQKEAIFYKGRTDYLKTYSAMYKESGFSTSYEKVTETFTVTVDGKAVTVVQEKHLPTFKYKDKPELQAMPSGPSEHPFWKFAGKFVDKGLETLLWWTGINRAADVADTLAKQSSPQYYGNYNPQTAAPYIVQPEIIFVPQ